MRYDRGIDRASGSKSTIFDSEKPVVQYDGEYLRRIQEGVRLGKSQRNYVLLKSPEEAFVYHRYEKAINKVKKQQQIELDRIELEQNNIAEKLRIEKEEIEKLRLQVIEKELSHLNIGRNDQLLLNSSKNKNQRKKSSEKQLGVQLSDTGKLIRESAAIESATDKWRNAREITNHLSKK